MAPYSGYRFQPHHHNPPPPSYLAEFAAREARFWAADAEQVVLPVRCRDGGRDGQLGDDLEEGHPDERLHLHPIRRQATREG